MLVFSDHQWLHQYGFREAGHLHPRPLKDLDFWWLATKSNNSSDVSRLRSIHFSHQQGLLLYHLLHLKYSRKILITIAFLCCKKVCLLHTFSMQLWCNVMYIFDNFSASTKARQGDHLFTSVMSCLVTNYSRNISYFFLSQLIRRPGLDEAPSNLDFLHSIQKLNGQY